MIDDIDNLMADLATAQASGRTPVERHAEFRQLFLGSDLGKRVLHDILAFGHIYANAPIREGNRTYEWLGERKMALAVLSAVNVMPKPKPAQQIRKPKES